MVQLNRLNTKAADGSVAAEKELGRRLEKARLDDLSKSMSAPAPRQERKGKKAEAQEAAEGIRGCYEPPAPPPGLLN